MDRVPVRASILTPPLLRDCGEEEAVEEVVPSSVDPSAGSRSAAISSGLDLTVNAAGVLQPPSHLVDAAGSSKRGPGRPARPKPAVGFPCTLLAIQKDA